MHPPSNPRHREFVERLWSGQFATRAYLAVGYQCSYAAARSSASRLLTRPDVVRYLEELRQKPYGWIPDPGTAPSLARARDAGGKSPPQAPPPARPRYRYVVR